MNTRGQRKKINLVQSEHKIKAPKIYLIEQYYIINSDIRLIFLDQF